ncbi:hypothetical protein AAFF_G00208610 [Aldrovandia affinis]|uniref:Serglycin n=1 Tax=Aldrovandia affinis TaxID=143900 RepID=A0AAD7RH96_9TELE|nr:hypothetical protein AAFF_G00208610 [Aldrovandia affinis]
MGLFLNISVTVALLSLLGSNTQGAPTKGRYMWVKCRPESKNANCVTEMANEIANYQSDDGSGNGQYFPKLDSGDQWEKDGRALGVLLHEEGSADPNDAPENDYTDFVFPERVYHKDRLLSDQEFQEENLIL